MTARDYIGYLAIHGIPGVEVVKNHMEKMMDNRMATGILKSQNPKPQTPLRVPKIMGSSTTSCAPP